jgi:protein NRD1
VSTGSCSVVSPLQKYLIEHAFSAVSQTGANHNTAHSAALLNNAGLDVNQLALLQQLARTAKSGAGGQDALIQVVPHLPPFIDNATFPPGPVQTTLNLPPNDPRARGNDGPVAVPRHESEGRNQGGGHRYGDDSDRRDWDYGREGGRGRGRGRGRGGYHGGWDDRSSYRDRDDSGSLSPRRHMRRGRSRSRSPPPRGPRGGGVPRRDYRARSPTTTNPRGPSTPTQPAAIKSLEPGKDEFGRDIRPGSVDPEPTPAQPTPPIPTETPTAPVSLLAQGPTPNPQLTTLSVATNGAPTEAAMPIATYESRERGAGTGKGLDSFDLTTFDFTSPTSWEALGKAWEVTNGVTPTQEMLMQFVMMSSMSIGMGMDAGVGGFGVGQQPNQWEGTQGSEGWDAEGMEWNGGEAGTVGDTQDKGKPDSEGADQEMEDTPVLGERSVGSTGKMQKVGDRWVFVRS